ncbi:MAG: nuclear transport factor 2 family protein [Streptomycetaceae bacterium]|nr:nuclear transport factor 2 family protein [Streptomycetaceae bacterium]
MKDTGQADGRPEARVADLAARLTRVEGRLRELEDERAIREVLVRYGFAVDSGDADATAALYTGDCVIDIDAGTNVLHGEEGARGLVDNEVHQAILPRCAHMIGPLVIRVDQDEAVATGYACVVVVDDGVPRIWRQGCNRWHLRRTDGGWRIARRDSAAIGSATAGALLYRGL